MSIFCHTKIPLQSVIPNGDTSVNKDMLCGVAVVKFSRENARKELCRNYKPNIH